MAVGHSHTLVMAIHKHGIHDSMCSSVRSGTAYPAESSQMSISGSLKDGEEIESIPGQEKVTLKMD